MKKLILPVKLVCEKIIELFTCSDANKLGDMTTWIYL